jgi:pimeloyl-ACP methyl ester carboxylesterase
MQQLGLERPVLLGHSHGGAVSLRLAVERPELLSALILLAPAHPWSGHECAIIAFYLSGFGRWFARLMPSVPEPLHWLAFKSMSGPKGMRDRSVLKYYRDSGKVPETVEHTLRLLTTWQADMDELRSVLDLQPIGLPVLVLWGDHDRVVPEKTAPALEQHLSQFEHITLPGIGHLPNEEAAILCGSHICRWLATVKPGDERKALVANRRADFGEPQHPSR